MDRRDMLAGTGAILAAAAAQGALAQGQDHSHHQHHAAARRQGLIDSSAECVSKGEVCLDHCFDALEQGEKEMADCARAVNQLVAVCGALRALAAQDGSHLTKLAKVAMDVCKECEEQCRKHEKKHVECKDCGDACATCYKECKKLVG